MLLYDIIVMFIINYIYVFVLLILFTFIYLEEIGDNVNVTLPFGLGPQHT